MSGFAVGAGPYTFIVHAAPLCQVQNDDRVRGLPEGGDACAYGGQGIHVGRPWPRALGPGAAPATRNSHDDRQPGGAQDLGHLVRRFRFGMEDEYLTIRRLADRQSFSLPPFWGQTAERGDKTPLPRTQTGTSDVASIA